MSRQSDPGRVCRRTFALVLGVAALGLIGASEAPHQHGVARLDVAVDAKTVTLLLDTPLDSLLGLERAPRNQAERREAAAVIAKLKAADTLFRVDPAAGCTLQSVELNAPVLLPPGPSVAGSAPAAANGHADLEATMTFGCRNAALATFIDTALFDFSHLRRVDVQVSAPAGQFPRVLTRDAARPLARIVLTK